MSAGDRFVDSAGATRVGSRQGFNAYATMADAVRAVEFRLRNGTPVWIWRLADGLFDYTVTERPVADATLVAAGYVRRRGSSNPNAKSYRLGTFIPDPPTPTSKENP